MTEKQRIGIAEYRVASAPQVLVSYGLGSCVGIVLYDPDLKLGGLAHTLLPERRSGMGEARPGKFVSLAIRQMWQELLELGADPERIVAKICGGAHMFHPPPEDPSRTIGQRNIVTARQTLAELGIELQAEDVGGGLGRTVEFDLASGKVLLRFARGQERTREL
ncbi:MAG TPA: chemotaxis protein CheD [Geothermobacteraceae bacterium]|nr:chemotaxis protein CheD [Geothermobacteraceae bacterium]